MMGEETRSTPSTYQRFQVTILCDWSLGDGRQCGEVFKDVPSFTSHVRAHYCPPSPSEPAVCRWNGCDFMSLDHEAVLQHILYHPYHQFLKLVGGEFQSKLHLPQCQVDDQFKNMVPSLLIRQRCQWDNGQCEEVFDRIGDFFAHVKDHIVIPECHQCKWKDCQFKGKSKSKLLEHCRTHTGEKIIACPQCGSVFASNVKFKDHLLRQQSTNDSPFSCSICFRSYASERLLREHVRRHINTVKCPHCDLTCNGPSRLHHHIRFRHSNETSHQCPICQKGFKTIHCLSEHLQVHNKKTYHCSVSGCKYVGKTLKSWQRHVKTAHMPESKLYCCHMCGICFSEGLKLSTHLKEVHGFSLPPGHSRFRYVTGADGYKRLQTVRLDADKITITK